MSIVAKENRAYLKRAWRHLLGTGLLKNKKLAAIILLTGLLTTLVQIGAVLLLIGAARAYDAQGILSFGTHTINLSETGGYNRIIYASVTGAILVTSILASVGHKLLVTRIGRKFYQDLLNDTRLRFIKSVKEGRGFNRSSYLQYLSRDCRYLSLSYIRVVNLIQPALLLIFVFIISLITVPIAAAFLGAASLLVLPLNIYLVLWAARTSQDIQSAAKLKSKEEADFIANASCDPFISEKSNQELIDVSRPGEQGFLSAFVKRQRMSTYSQSITDFMMVLVIIALAALLFFGGGNTLLLKLSSLVILVILFRFITSYISNLSQAVMMVSSYEPFFRPLLDLYEGEHASQEPLEFSKELDDPIRVAIFQRKKSDWSDVSVIAKALKIDTPLQMVTADFTPSKPQAANALKTSNALKLSDKIKAELKEFTDGASNDLSNTAKLFLALSHSSATGKNGFLIDGALLRDLDRLELRTVFDAADDKPIIVVNRAVPRRLILPSRFQLLSRSPSKLTLIGHAHEFNNKRETISKMMQIVTNNSETSVADENMPSDIIV